MAVPKGWWKDEQTRIVALFVFTGLVVSWVRHGLEHHWKTFSSWEQFFTYWIVHTLALGIFVIFAAGATIGTHNFFLGFKWRQDKGELIFYMVMTVLIGALSIAFLTNYAPPDDDHPNLTQRRTVVRITFRQLHSTSFGGLPAASLMHKLVFAF